LVGERLPGWVADLPGDGERLQFFAADGADDANAGIEQPCQNRPQGGMGGVLLDVVQPHQRQPKVGKGQLGKLAKLVLDRPQQPMGGKHVAGGLCGGAGLARAGVTDQQQHPFGGGGLAQRLGEPVVVVSGHIVQVGGLAGQVDRLDPEHAPIADLTQAQRRAVGAQRVVVEQPPVQRRGPDPWDHRRPGHRGHCRGEAG
jgi:hypothetical protein